MSSYYKKTCEITINGICYYTLKHACDAASTTTPVANRRLRRGWTLRQSLGLDDAPIDQEKKIVSHKKPLTIDGRNFASLSEAERHYNMYHGEISAKLKKGWTLEEACGLHTRQISGSGGRIYRITQTSTGKIYIGATNYHDAFRRRWINGHVHLANSSKHVKPFSLHRAIRDSGIDDFIFEIVASCETRNDLGKLEIEWIKMNNSLYPNGFNIHLGGLGDRYGRAKKITVEGITYKSVRQAAEKYGLDERTVNARLTIYKWSTDEAFQIDSEKRYQKAKTQITVFGKTYDSIMNAFHVLKPPSSLLTIQKRIKEGILTMDEIFTLSGVFSKSKPITVFGIEYESIAYAARILKSNYTEGYIAAKIKRGYHPDRMFINEMRP